jgi:hypothetical protein
LEDLAIEMKIISNQFILEMETRSIEVSLHGEDLKCSGNG